MSELLKLSPFGPRDERLFLSEMIELTGQHLRRSLAYSRVWPDWTSAASSEQLPYLHASLFKSDLFAAAPSGTPGRSPGRTLMSSGTSTGRRSRIPLDAESSDLQKRSAAAILQEFLGRDRRPLLILDSSKALNQRGEISARIAAALSLLPLATSVHLLLGDETAGSPVLWDRVRRLDVSGGLIVYGLTPLLWFDWALSIPDDVRERLRAAAVAFVHSGGWKKLEQQGVGKAEFDGALLRGAGAGSRVVDFYGLVEQIGVPYPLCEAGYRHVPVWADVLVRDAHTLNTVVDDAGLLQLMNPFALGAPHHSVLTEDLGRIVSGDCACGRLGKRFELLGRIPRAEVRGCANV